MSSVRNPSVSVVTPSGGRPLQLSLCRQMVNEQTYENILEHIVVQDIDRSVSENLLELLKHVKGDIVTIFEDDDYYRPDWIKLGVEKIKSGYTAFGAGQTRYYFLPNGGHYLITHPKRSSLHGTFFLKDRWLDYIISKCNDADSDNHIDVKIWPEIVKSGEAYLLDNPHNLSIKWFNIGRQGAGVGHKFKSYFRFDRDRSLLKKWAPDKYDLYMSIIKYFANHSEEYSDWCVYF